MVCATCSIRVCRPGASCDRHIEEFAQRRTCTGHRYSGTGGPVPRRKRPGHGDRQGRSENWCRRDSGPCWRIRVRQVDAGAGDTKILVHDTGLSNSDDDHAFQFKGTHVDNTLEVRSGTVDLARTGGELAVIATLTTTDRSTVRASEGVTLTNVNAEGSSRVDIDAAPSSTIATLNINGSAAVTITGVGAAAGDITALNIFAGTCDYLGSGTIATLLVTAEGAISFANNTAGFIVTTNNSVEGSTIDDSHAKGTWTDAFSVGVRLPNVTWDFGPGRTIQIVTI